MVKAGWLAVVFVAGIAIGVFIERGQGGASSANEAPTPVVAAQRPAEDQVRMVIAPPAESTPGRPASAPAAIPATGVPPAMPPAAAATADASGDVHAIDVGPVFSKQFAETATQGYRDAAAEAHHALEREARDDSWAYPMEAEIENSLVADTSMGNFKKEHVECRASMCEVRLTARGPDQAAALQRWNESLRSQPWSPRLFMSSSSVSNNDNNVDALLIFTRPPPPKKD